MEYLVIYLEINNVKSKKSVSITVVTKANYNNITSRKKEHVFFSILISRSSQNSNKLLKNYITFTSTKCCKIVLITLIISVIITMYLVFYKGAFPARNECNYQL